MPSLPNPKTLTIASLMPQKFVQSLGPVLAKEHVMDFVCQAVFGFSSNSRLEISILSMYRCNVMKQAAAKKQVLQDAAAGEH